MPLIKEMAPQRVKKARRNSSNAEGWNKQLRSLGERPHMQLAMSCVGNKSHHLPCMPAILQHQVSCQVKSSLPTWRLTVAWKCCLARPMATKPAVMEMRKRSRRLGAPPSLLKGFIACLLALWLEDFVNLDPKIWNSNRVMVPAICPGFQKQRVL